jgi:hypothetical protein
VLELTNRSHFIFTILRLVMLDDITMLLH